MKKRLNNITIKKKIMMSIFIVLISIAIVFGILAFISYQKNAGEISDSIVCPAAFCGIFSFIVIVLYFARFNEVSRNIKWLKKIGLYDEIPEKITDEKYFSNSRLYCGEKFIFSKENSCVLPYSEMLWIYVRVLKTNFIETGRVLDIHMRDGEAFSIFFSKKDFESIMKDHILLNNSHLIFGYGKEQSTLYDIEKNKYLNHEDK